MRLPGIYGFELKARVDTPESSYSHCAKKPDWITRDRREIPARVVRHVGAERAN
jgi:hypothetical protein